MERDKTLVPGLPGGPGGSAIGALWRRDVTTSCAAFPAIRRPLHFRLRTVPDNRVTGVTARL